MKIAIVCYPTFGGSGVLATELGIALAKKGHEIHFISYKQPVRLDLLESNILFHQVHVPEYPLFHYLPYELALSSKLVDVIRFHGINVLHVHYAIPHAYAAYMTKQMLADQGINIPIVTTLHGTDITLVGKHPFYKTAVNFSINQSDIVTAVSQSLKKETLEIFDVSKNIRVIPNFIDTDKYKLENIPFCQRTLLASPNERIITHISNFRKVKRIQDVVKVFCKVQKEIKAKLVLVGEGPQHEHIEQCCKKYGISDKVLFLGETYEVDKVLHFSDVFLLPSETESFGLAALEAMASGVPVVSSNSGGLPELNIDNVTGHLCAIGDVEDMSTKVISLLQDDKKLNKFKENSKKRALNFDISLIITKYEQMYSEAINIYRD